MDRLIGTILVYIVFCVNMTVCMLYFEQNIATWRNYTTYTRDKQSLYKVFLSRINAKYD